MDPLDQKLLLEMETFNGIFAKSADEKERLARLEKDGLAESSQDQPREGVRILPPRRFRLTELGRTALASFKLEK
jgi:predicted ArsR family transcriptional regulator